MGGVLLLPAKISEVPVAHQLLALFWVIDNVLQRLRQLGKFIIQKVELKNMILQQVCAVFNAVSHHLYNLGYLALKPKRCIY